MSSGTLLLLRLLHIVTGVVWVGAVTLLTLLILPSLRAAGPAGGAVMQQLTQVRRMPLWLMAGSVLTLVSGIGLYWHDSGGFQSSAWLGSGSGRMFGLGGVLAIAGAAIGMIVNGPAAKRLGELMGQIQSAGRPPSADQSAELQRLQGRLSSVGMLVMILLLLATAAMAVARYM
jgi:uncharacterized membrane protein